MGAAGAAECRCSMLEEVEGLVDQIEQGSSTADVAPLEHRCPQRRNRGEGRERGLEVVETHTAGAVSTGAEDGLRGSTGLAPEGDSFDQRSLARSERRQEPGGQVGDSSDDLHPPLPVGATFSHLSRQGSHDRPQRLEWRLVVGAVEDRLTQAVRLIHVEPDDRVFFRREVVEEGPDRHVGSLCDVFHGHLVQPTTQYELERARPQGLVGGQPLAISTPWLRAHVPRFAFHCTFCNFAGNAAAGTPLDKWSSCSSEPGAGPSGRQPCDAVLRDTDLVTPTCSVTVRCTRTIM